MAGTFRRLRVRLVTLRAWWRSVAGSLFGSRRVRAPESGHPPRTAATRPPHAPSASQHDLEHRETYTGVVAACAAEPDRAAAQVLARSADPGAHPARPRRQPGAEPPLRTLCPAPAAVGRPMLKYHDPCPAERSGRHRASSSLPVPASRQVHHCLYTERRSITVTPEEALTTARKARMRSLAVRRQEDHTGPC